MRSTLLITSFFLLCTLLGCKNSVRIFSFKGVKPVNDPFYEETCGGCHYAYPPGLLPEKSWKKLIAETEDHFGENLELEQEDIAKLLTYLSKNAANHSFYKRSRKIILSLKNGDAPLRITQVPYIKDKHKNIPKKYIDSNPKVKHLGNCNACHTSADMGSFDDDAVFIPDYGRWDD